MNKKIALAGLLCLFLSVGNISNSFAGPLDFLNQGSSSDKSVDLDKLSYNGTKLILRVGKATGAFSDAAITMLTAVGLKEKAEKLKAVQDEAKKNPDDPEKVKKLVSSTNEALDELNKVDLESNKNLAGSQGEILNAFGNFGGGAYLDAKAVEDAKDIVKETTSVIDLVKGNPIKYGFSAIGTVNSVLGSGKFIIDNVPQQVKSVHSFMEKLVAYFKANKIEVPSPDKLKTIADSLEKG